MLLSIVVIVLRETLEASILTAVLLAISQQHKTSPAWLLIAVALGSISATVYAYNFSFISELFDYVGQEIVNALLQFGIYLCCLLICFIHFRQSLHLQRWLSPLMISAVCLTITREGAELFVFFSGFLHGEHSFSNIITSSFVGLAIGMSAGVVVFYSISLLSSNRSRWIANSVLTLIAAGTVRQAIQLLIQADWLPSSTPLWNTEWLLPESSIFGQAAYAIFSYESTPTSIELTCYFAAIATTLLLILLYPKSKTTTMEKPHG